MIEPAPQYCGFHDSFQVLESRSIKFETLRVRSHQDCIHELIDNINGELSLALDELRDQKPDIIYLPSAELSDTETIEIFRWQFSNLAHSSRIYIKNHPRDKRDT